MGWGRMLLLGNVGQQLDIQDTQETLAQIGESLRRTHDFKQRVGANLQELATENAELKLYLAAIVRVLVAKGIVTAKELEQLVDALDRDDGQRDGRFEGKIAPS